MINYNIYIIYIFNANKVKTGVLQKVSPLFTLLMKDAQFIWNDACQTTLTKVKKRLSTAPILRGANWDLPFHISFDSCNTLIFDPICIKMYMMYIL